MKRLAAVAGDSPVRWLADATGASESATGVWLWGGILIAVAAVGLVVMLSVRRRLFKRDDSTPQGWTLQDIRELHASGQLTDEEYANLRQKIVGTASGGESRRSSADGDAVDESGSGGRRRGGK